MSNLHPECWTTSDVCMWLREKGFGLYVDSFKKHRIDGEALLLLTEKDLKEDLQITVSLDAVLLSQIINLLEYFIVILFHYWCIMLSGFGLS